MSVNAVSELARLNSGQVIPADFWPDHVTRHMDEDRSQPWWERKSGHVGETGDENYNEYTLDPLNFIMHRDSDEVWDEHLELWLRLSREMDRDLQVLSSDNMRDKDGVYAIHLGVPRDFVINESWRPYVSDASVHTSAPIVQEKRPSLLPARESLRVVGDKKLGIFAKREIYGMRKRLGEPVIQSHGKHGRKPSSYHAIFMMEMQAQQKAART